jgi:hypothetical protein
VDVAIVGVAGTLLGVVLGAVLAHRTAMDVAAQQREWDREARLHERHASIAARFDEALLDAFRDVPMGVESGRVAAQKLREGQVMFQSAWRRTTALDDEGLERRITALDMALVIAETHARFGPDEEINHWALSVAFRDLRKALGAFQQAKPLPEPEFPTPTC